MSQLKVALNEGLDAELTVNEIKEVLVQMYAQGSMEGVNSQLQAHCDIGLNTGLTEAQMKSLITVLESKVGKQEADNANEVLGKALSSRAK